jgi:hypothetical protein
MRLLPAAGTGFILGLAALGDFCLGMTIEPLRKVHVSELSVEEFDSAYLDKRPVIITGATACPGDFNFSNIHQYCDGHVPGSYIRTKSRGSGEWAGLKAGDEQEDVDFLEFASSMGTGEGELRYMFDVSMVEQCPSLLNNVRIPPQFVDSFASQFLWRHLEESDPRKCDNAPFFNMYLAEGGFETDLHIDSAHTAFLASMCVGRKKWRVMTADSFQSLHSRMALANEGRQVNGRWIMSEVQRPFETWSSESPLHSMDTVIYEGILVPGEVLYIPQGAPHAAATLDKSLMVASNDQSMQSLREIIACDGDYSQWFGCIRFRERFDIVKENYDRYASKSDRKDMTFAQSFDCERAFEQLSQHRLEITPLNFVEEARKGPMIIMKYIRSCMSCIQLFNLLDGFDPPVRLGVLHCPRGRCPRGESASYQKVLPMVRGECPEFVFVAPSRQTLPMRGSLNAVHDLEVPITVSHYYGPLELDFLKVWISTNTGSTVDISPRWWKAFIMASHMVNGATVAILQGCGVPPMADDSAAISALLIVILFVLPCIGAFYACASGGEKRKAD